MNVVDSSGWLEYFTDDKNADYFADKIVDINNLVVPTICIYEVFKRIMQQRGESAAQGLMTVMSQGRVVDLDMSLALSAAELSLAHKIPMADSIILATAYAHQATLWTQDAHLKDLPGVQYIAKPSVNA